MCTRYGAGGYRVRRLLAARQAAATLRAVTTETTSAEREIIDLVARAGFVDPAGARARPLAGGVSSDIYLVSDAHRRVVFKRALPQLRVADEWCVDVRRNDAEQAYLEVAGEMVPGAVPEVLHGGPGYFVMEHLGDEFVNWKARLMAGDADAAHAITAGALLGRLHGGSWDRPALRARFDTTEDFHALRTHPYLLTTGERHPSLRALFEAEAGRLESTRRCLVHGDFSPKNILLRPGRMVILDCEVAWYGDPAFDPAFLFTHFMLKALHHVTDPAPFAALVPTAWEAYREELGPDRAAAVPDEVVGRLVLMLMLARVDGKSPVEYLDSESRREVVRGFVCPRLERGASPGLRALADEWLGWLGTHGGEES